MRSQLREGLTFKVLLPLFLVLFVPISSAFGQSDCGFLTGPEGLSAGCQDSCVWVVPDFERAAETTGYEVDSIAYAPPLEVGTGAVQSTATNGYTDGIGLPFGFSFFNTNFFQLKVSRKGFVTFNVGLGGGYNYPNQPLGNGALPPNSIMAPYAYISNSGGEIRTATLGEAPCRRFVISWENLPQTGCGANELITQVVLYETSNVVEMHIGQFQTCLGITACVGIQGGGNEGAYGPAAYDTGEFAIDDLAFRYSPNGDTQTEITYLWQDMMQSGDSIEICDLTETVEVIIGANFPVIEQPPAVSDCSGIPSTACDTSMVYDYNLDAAETSTFSFPLDGSLLGMAVTNNWVSNGLSYPGDMGVQICTPSGTCGFIEGWNINLSGINLGPWPGNWNTISSGTYDACFTVGPQFSGDGNWSITIQNGWTLSNNNVNFDGTITLFYACDLEPEDPTEFMAVDTIVIDFTSESQTAEFAILDAGGSPLDVLCSGDEPVSLVAETEGGVWSADCVGCLNTEGEIDPSQVAPGLLEVAYTLDGDCGEVTEVEEIQVGLTPFINTGNVGALCPFSEPVQLSGLPGGGAWEADCGGCVTSEGLFDPAVGSGTYTAEYTFGTLCTATESVEINVGDAVAAQLEDLSYCESIGSVQLDDDGLAGTWTADCGGCILPSGIFLPPGPGAYAVSFMPGAGCGVESSATIVVDQNLPIGSANVPEALCVEADPVALEADVPGGTWSATGSGLNGATFDPQSAGPGTSVLSYVVENGSCTNSADFPTTVLPVLSVSLEEEAPFCVNSSGSTLDADIDLDAEAFWQGFLPDLEWDADCGGCINGNGVFDPGDAGIGTHTVTLSYDDPYGCSVAGSIEVVVAPAVDATIDAIPDLCESGADELFTAADPGGTWTASCGDCLSPAGLFDMDSTLFPNEQVPGNYTITYTITDVCTDIDAVQITVVPQRDATIVADNAITCIGAGKYQFAAAEQPYGTWSLEGAESANAIDASGLLNLQAAGVGLVTIHHVIDGLCGDEDAFELEILPCVVEEFPNIITPSLTGVKDDPNHALVFPNLEYYQPSKLVVFNRFGSIVFESERYDNDWSAEEVADGVYYYILEMPGGRSHSSSLQVIHH